jgi:hypothetical protein
MMDTAEKFRACDAQELIRQIGTMNLFAISGGRIERRETGITLPVGAGYSVTIDLDFWDEYVVRRVFRRAGKTWIKGEQRRVDCFEVGEVAYRASCFRNGPWGQTDNFPEGGD